MINLVAIVVCVYSAIICGINGEFGFCLIDFLLAILNLPFVIKYIKERG